ncbi:unnamed protein product [Bemisia tabaci]|uniref:Sodium/nucleoside cotransporter n=1 Tax=Bemisia tabaci TaxID=7038 RepID=A0A9P0AGU8_BEMTA|nr:unnamed protein product [Bemisia tabaci]
MEHRTTEISTKHIEASSCDGELSSIKSMTHPEKKDENINETLPQCTSFPASTIIRCRQKLSELQSKYSQTQGQFLRLSLHLALIVYFIAVVFHWKNTHKPINWCNGTGFMTLIITVFYWTIFYYNIFKPFILPFLSNIGRLKHSCVIFRYIKLSCWVAITISLTIFIIVDTASDRRRLISLAGLFFFIFIGFIFSKHPGHVKWGPVVVGIYIQLLMGLLVIRWNLGRNIIECVGHQIEAFLEFANVGAEFVYGKQLIRTAPVFAFQALCSVYFLNFISQILFYYGWMQKICLIFGVFLKSILDTTVVESVYTCASVFLGMNEAPLLVTPYLKYLTVSEIHAVMTGGFATVAGSVFAAYISVGVDPAHIVTASIMSAPAALSYAKLIYPETEHSTTAVDNIADVKSDESNVIEAACKGAAAGIELVLRIVATVLCFVAFATFVNGCLGWLGLLVGVEGLSMGSILGTMFIPVALIMGVDPAQSYEVAQLIGIKTSLNEFIAYEKLGELKRENRLSARSEAIATFALCGFSNPAAMGGLIGTLSTLCPEQTQNVTKVAFRAVIAGSITCFITACVAGLLIPEDGFSADA